MHVFRIEIAATQRSSSNDAGSAVIESLRRAGLNDARDLCESRLVFVEGRLSHDDAERIACELLIDPITETADVSGEHDSPSARPNRKSIEIHLRPGVMDPVAETTRAELEAEGYTVSSVRTARRLVLSCSAPPEVVAEAVKRTIANDCIERVIIGTLGAAPAPTPSQKPFEIRSVALDALDSDGLEALSRRGHLFLSVDEMRAIQTHFRTLGRAPTDLELETIAQTWSEHCIHKTLKSAVTYRGAPFPNREFAATGDVEISYSNLLKDTIVRATSELMRAGRGPTCLSVFRDNAGIIAFDDEFGIAFKVETHNRPSAIEPYGGAATGAGGCIRDVLGVGLGALPIASTDVFCVAPSEWPFDALPRGVLHPARILRGVVDGVGDYGNRMGIPTVNGAVHFDPRYLGNPLVFCGCVGLIPRHRVQKQVQPNDHIVLVGGRTGRDGIHGATFSSAELSDSHGDEFSHAVQIGNAIEEKRVLDLLMRAREFRPAAGDPNSASQCLYNAITDCGAGGLSSAIGEMGEHTGAVVELDRVPLKYAGLRYDEIWISEAQERMVLAVPERNLAAFFSLAREEGVEATAIGVFGSDSNESRDQDARAAGNRPRLIAKFAGRVVGELDMEFLHRGVPMPSRRAEWRPIANIYAPSGTRDAAPMPSCDLLASRLLESLRNPTAASKESIIRRYDHEVRGGTVIKPLMGRGNGPTDAAVLRPRLDRNRGIAIGCGLAPALSDIDPYWMAAAAIDEALCNVVAVGGDPRKTALLDNFCWGRCDDPRQMGALVRTCQACYDAAIAWSAPFISGKDSLNNEFSLDARDVPTLLAHIRKYLTDTQMWGYPDGTSADALIASIEQRVRATGRLSVPGTLLISALAIVSDVQRCVSCDLKLGGAQIYLVGGLSPLGFDFEQAARIRMAVAESISRGLVGAAHDAGGGWLTALAEMIIGGDRGAELDAVANAPDAFAPLASAFVLESTGDGLESHLRSSGVAFERLGTTAREIGGALRLPGAAVAISDLRAAWRGM